MRNRIQMKQLVTAPDQYIEEFGDRGTKKGSPGGT